MLLNLKKQYLHEFIAKIWQYSSQISSILINTQENCAKTQAIPKKLKQIPKKLKDFPKKTQGTGGFSLFDPPKKRDKKKPVVTL